MSRGARETLHEAPRTVSRIGTDSGLPTTKPPSTARNAPHYLAIAGQVGSRLLEARNQRLRVIRVQADQAAREQKRELERSAREQERPLQAQRAAEIGSLRPVSDPAWWENATPGDIAKSWEIAAAWAPVDERAQAAAAGMVQNVQERYGIDLNRLHEPEDPAAVLTGVREVATELSLPGWSSRWGGPRCPRPRCFHPREYRAGRHTWLVRPGR